MKQDLFVSGGEQVDYLLAGKGFQVFGAGKRYACLSAGRVTLNVARYRYYSIPAFLKTFFTNFKYSRLSFSPTKNPPS